MKKLLVLILSGLTLAACAPQGTAPESPANTVDKPVVYTTNYPVFYLADRIAGGAAEVVFPAPASADPAYWKPSDEIIASYQAADLILLNGAEFEKWVPKTSLPEARMVNTSEGAKDAYIEIEDAMVHSHGPEGKHAHAGYDFNTWLDPSIAIQQARTIAARLSELLPDQEDAIKARVPEISKDLSALDSALKELSEAHPDVPLIVSHPVYNYLARRYQWNLKSLHWEPGEMPADEEWSALQDLLQTHQAKFIIWEGDPDPAIVERLKGLGLGSVVFYPLANRPSEGDYVSAMQANIARLKEALSAS